MKLTEHFTLEEFEQSDKATRLGLDNSIPTELLPNVKRTAEAMEEVRHILDNRPITVSSGYRGLEVNKAVGGSLKSAHMQGLACDFICPAFGTPYQIAEVLAAALQDFDQIIWEGTWVHLGLADGFQRREVLTAKFPNGKAVYTKGLNHD